MVLVTMRLLGTESWRLPTRELQAAEIELTRERWS